MWNLTLTSPNCSIRLSGVATIPKWWSLSNARSFKWGFGKQTAFRLYLLSWSWDLFQKNKLQSQLWTPVTKEFTYELTWSLNIWHRRHWLAGEPSLPHKCKSQLAAFCSPHSLNTTDAKAFHGLTDPIWFRYTSFLPALHSHRDAWFYAVFQKQKKKT